MNLLDDLDGACWLAAAATLTLCACILFLSLWNRRNGWAVDIRKLAPILGPLGALCMIGAFNSYSSYDEVPRRAVVGAVHVVGEKRGRSYTEYICADTCQSSGGYAIALDAGAARAISRRAPGTRFQFTYPDRPSGSAFSGVSLVVERIAEADSGEILYQRDLLNHRYRIAFYVGDLVLLVGAVCFSICMAPR